VFIYVAKCKKGAREYDIVVVSRTKTPASKPMAQRPNLFQFVWDHDNDHASIAPPILRLDDGYA